MEDGLSRPSMGTRNGFLRLRCGSPESNAQGRVTHQVARPWKESEQQALIPGSAVSRVGSHTTPLQCSVALPDVASVTLGNIRTIDASPIIITTGTGAG